MNKLMILSGAALLGMAGAAIAQPPEQSDARGRGRAVDVTRADVIQRSDAAFARLDANHDGRLAFEEWALSSTRRFAEADADHDASLNRTEFAATAPRRRPQTRQANCRC
jgi:hypothetical protein